MTERELYQKLEEFRKAGIITNGEYFIDGNSFQYSFALKDGVNLFIKITYQGAQFFFKNPQDENVYKIAGEIDQHDHVKEVFKKLEERLKKYTCGKNHKKYYEKNKEKVMENSANYLQKLKEENPEKLKEYRRNYYLKRKENKIET